MSKLKNSKCEEEKNWKCDKSRTQNVTEFKNQKCNIPQKPKIWQNSKTENGIKLKNWKCDNKKCDQTQKQTIW